MEEAAPAVMLTVLESRALMSREDDMGVLMWTEAPAGRSSCRMIATGAVTLTRVALGVLRVRVERVVASTLTVPAFSACSQRGGGGWQGWQGAEDWVLG